MAISGVSGSNALTSLLNDRQKTPSSDDADASWWANFFKESPAQQMQDLWLMKHGLTEKQFNALPADQKEKLLEQMKQETEQQIKEKAQAASQSILST